MKIIKPISCCDCSRLLNVIEAYILKADESLEEQLEDEGYASPKLSVEEAAILEEELATILGEQTDDIIDLLNKTKSWDSAKKVLYTYFSDDKTTRMMYEDAFVDFYKRNIITYATDYIKASSGDMVVERVRQRTTSWMQEWSSELSDIMQVSSSKQMEQLISTSMKKGESVADLTRKLMESGIRNEQYRARRVALTEMLRCHSVAKNEAIMQSPVVTKRMWRHSGTYKIKPRANHQAMDGQIVEKDKPYTLIGADGNTYYPRYPHDISLPPSESINCHCLEQEIVDKDVLGMSLEERQKLQQQIIEDDDGEWEKELDAKNKAKAGITNYEETKTFRGPSVSGQDYKNVEYDNSSKVSSQRDDTPITATKVVTTKNKLYVSDNLTIKRRAVHVIDKGLTETYDIMGIADNDNLPNIVILTDAEFKKNAVATYSAAENTMYLRAEAGAKRSMRALQVIYAAPEKYISTYAHEMYHWKDAEEYKKIYGEITTKKDSQKYIKWIRKRAKKELEKIVKSGYDVDDISIYATRCIKSGDWEEVYTEYRVSKLLGE